MNEEDSEIILVADSLDGHLLKQSTNEQRENDAVGPNKKMVAGVEDRLLFEGVAENKGWLARLAAKIETLNNVS